MTTSPPLTALSLRASLSQIGLPTNNTILYCNFVCFNNFINPNTYSVRYLLCETILIEYGFDTTDCTLIGVVLFDLCPILQQCPSLAQTLIQDITFPNAVSFDDVTYTAKENADAIEYLQEKGLLDAQKFYFNLDKVGF